MLIVEKKEKNTKKLVLNNLYIGLILYTSDALIPGINPGRELPGTRYQQQGLFWSPAFYLKS